MSEETTGVERLADQIVEAARTGDAAAVGASLLCALGMPRHATPAGTAPKVRIYRWLCWMCDGTGQWGDDEKCMECHGYGLLADEDIRDPAAHTDLKPAPRPPAVMKSPCVDCAFRPGSPEEEDLAANYGYPPLARPGAEKPFFCHHGMHRLPGGGYESPAYVGSLPLGAMVCAGWWALATGEALPAKAFRDPGGADRPESAPEVA
jgi:hypothetical protein